MSGNTQDPATRLFYSFARKYRTWTVRLEFLLFQFESQF